MNNVCHLMPYHNITYSYKMILEFLMKQEFIQDSNYVLDKITYQTLYKTFDYIPISFVKL